MSTCDNNERSFHANPALSAHWIVCLWCLQGEDFCCQMWLHSRGSAGKGSCRCQNRYTESESFYAAEDRPERKGIRTKGECKIHIWIIYELGDSQRWVIPCKTLTEKNTSLKRIFTRLKAPSSLMKEAFVADVPLRMSYVHTKQELSLILTKDFRSFLTFVFFSFIHLLLSFIIEKQKHFCSTDNVFILIINNVLRDINSNIMSMLVNHQNHSRIDILPSYLCYKWKSMIFQQTWLDIFSDNLMELFEMDADSSS